jgi:hypothetical protein
MALTTGLALAQQVRELAGRTAVLGAISGKRYFYLATAAGVVGYPLLAAATLGALVGAALDIGPTAPGMTATMPTTMILTMLACASVTSIAATLISMRSLLSAASGWAGRDCGR